MNLCILYCTVHGVNKFDKTTDAGTEGRDANCMYVCCKLYIYL